MALIRHTDESLRVKLYIDGYLPAKRKLERYLSVVRNDHKPTFWVQGRSGRDRLFFSILYDRLGEYACKFLHESKTDPRKDPLIELFLLDLNSQKVASMPEAVREEIRGEKSRNRNNYRQLIFTFSGSTYPHGGEAIPSILENMQFTPRLEQSYKDYPRFKTACEYLIQRL